MDSNGYNPSIMQSDLARCYICGRNDEPLHRHEVFHADYKGVIRRKSKAWGLWVMLCGFRCHEIGKYSVHRCRETDLLLKKEAQQRAMDYYGITVEEFINEFGRSYL